MKTSRGSGLGQNLSVVGEKGGGLALGRQFLFLQGPHGPFFRMLARSLRRKGASVLKVGFNRADDREWAETGPYQAYVGKLADWPAWLSRLMQAGLTQFSRPSRTSGTMPENLSTTS